MKIEKLTDNKIRIILNLDELSEKKLDIHSFIQNNEIAHNLFNTILHEAEKQVGFKVNNCKLYVEAFSTSDGFIIFTLTKYKNDISLRNNSKKLKLRLKLKGKIIHNFARNAIYKFKDFDEFCNFCSYCNTSKLADLNNFAKNISLYEYKSSYYLVLSNINSKYKYSSIFYTSISEFSDLISTSDNIKGKLEEYGKVIFKSGAIKNGIKYFSTT